MRFSRAGAWKRRGIRDFSLEASRFNERMKKIHRQIISDPSIGRFWWGFGGGGWGVGGL